MLTSQRHLFDIPDDVVWLNCAYMAPLLRAVSKAGEDGIRRKIHPWTITPPDFFNEAERARRLFARLIGCDTDSVALTPSASYGVSVAARNVSLCAGQNIVILDEQYPSNVYAWMEAARRAGAGLSAVARPVDGAWSDAVIDAIDDRTAVAALPHCHWTDGALMDLERIGARCRETGAALVLDLTQSLGALPFDVGAVRPDFISVACYKWLLGPYASGFLYAAPRYHDGNPIEYNWITRGGSEDFAGLVEYRKDYQPGARRFDMGERANFHLLPMTIAALEQVLEWGVEAIASSLETKTRGIAERTAKLGLESLTRERRAGHFLGLRFPEGLPAGLPDALARRGIFVSVRGNSLRVTPHLYNTDADVDRLLDALEALV